MKDIIAGWRQGNWGGGREEVQSLKTGEAHPVQHRLLLLQEGPSTAAEPHVSHGGTCAERQACLRSWQKRVYS